MLCQCLTRVPKGKLPKVPYNLSVFVFESKIEFDSIRERLFLSIIVMTPGTGGHFNVVNARSGGTISPSKKRQLVS